ncbi:SDR family oxidoreductase [Thiohalobacter sp. IOR34]|uniref:SDR family oxidoreductase n=1 Tax=Thiohalobacter sp. IOR34 TaxID=3057176 RepID=UPI0025B1601A|nr:SDR family oxidoreductase [Thiohalobacter sp. IOR34]WJW75599.1 SDR family oxidoreductase [Thiohalobacter sp. IOR34]
MNPVLIVGCGYIGRRVAAACLAEGGRVYGVVRSADSARRLEAEGIRALPLDLDRERVPADWPTAGARLYYFAPPPAEGVSDPRIERLLEALQGPRCPARIVYISTTGVYGDCGGRWIDESEPAKPATDRARRRHAAEQALRRWSAASGVPVVILRVPGIYGPGKLPLERLRRGLPLLDEADSPYTNRIHAEDLVAACRAAMAHPAPGPLYNVADGRPSNMTDYFNRIADAAGLPRPPTVSRAEAGTRLSAGMRAFMDESKRIDNRRLREELGVSLAYPDLDAGLAACLGEP